MMNVFSNQIIVGIIVNSSLILFLALVVFNKLRHLKAEDSKRSKQKMAQLAYEKELLEIEVEIQNHKLKQHGAGLHENLGQLLAVIKINLSLLEDDPAMPQAVRSNLNETNEIASKAITLIRGMCRELETDFLVRYGLIESLSTEMLRIRRGYRIETELICLGHQYALGIDIEFILLGISQEFLNMSVKSWKLTSLKIVIDYLADKVCLELSASGVEINFVALAVPKTSRSGFVVENIRRRIDLIGASYSLKLKENEGAIFKLEIPAKKKTWI